MDWRKAYRNEILLTTIWVVFILFVDVNPLVYWKGIMNVKIFGFPGQYGFYLLNLVFIVPVASFIGAYLANKIELQITGEVEPQITGEKKKV